MSNLEQKTELRFLSLPFTSVDAGSNPTSDRSLACGLGFQSLLDWVGLTNCGFHHNNGANNAVGCFWINVMLLNGSKRLRCECMRFARRVKDVKMRDLWSFTISLMTFEACIYSWFCIELWKSFTAPLIWKSKEKQIKITTLKSYAFWKLHVFTKLKCVHPGSKMWNESMQEWKPNCYYILKKDFKLCLVGI